MIFIDKISELFSNYKNYIFFTLLLIVYLLTISLNFIYFQNNINSLKEKIKDRPIVEVKKQTKESENYIVDIKGEVKTPGVYYLEKGKRVIDVVKKAGGFTIDADSSANNLSMKISDEMVIVIYSKKQIKNYQNTKEKEEKLLENCQNEIIKNDSCIETVNGIEKEKTSKVTTKTDKKTSNSSKKIAKNEKETSENKQVSINTATKEELMTISGIGESKAEAIIEYRQNKKFESIEEIKEVSGIGDSLFEKIKDYITT